MFDKLLKINMVPVGIIINFEQIFHRPTSPCSYESDQSFMDLSRKWKDPYCIVGKLLSVYFEYIKDNRMAWQWAETLVEIRGTLADIRGTTK